jgi:transcriptional regulator with XRE-family HTH domain
MRHNVRQVELAELLGYEQSYISALEVGLKGPPTQEFIERLKAALPLSSTEQQELLTAVEASQRKLILDSDTPQDVYWLLKELREAVQLLSPVHVRMIRDVLSLRGAAVSAGFAEPASRLKRRIKGEATM